MAILKENKIYYSITEVSKLLKITTATIRFWETKFSSIKTVKRERNKRRKYILRDIQTLHKINNLLHIQGFTVKGAIKVLEDWKPELSFNDFDQLLKNEISDLIYDNGKVSKPPKEKQKELLPRKGFNDFSKLNSDNKSEIERIMKEVNGLIGKIKY